MTIASLTEPTPGRRGSWALASRPGFWCLIAFTAICARGLILQASAITSDLNDSDDALRLMQVRELLAGASWFEVTTMALGGKGGLVSHWSRLIDLPLAALLSLLKLVLPVARAEFVLRALWPLVVLAPLMLLMARAMETARGQAAAYAALGLLALSPTALYQFDPGRIDHHNIMIAATISSTLLMWANPGHGRSWLIAGALAALALAVGYEALAPVIAMAGLAALWGLFDRRQGPATAAFVAGLVVTLALALVLTRSPEQWLTSHCDTLSANIVVLSAASGAGLVLVLTSGADWPMPARIAVLAVSGALGLAGFGALEPACLAGPMAQVPKSLTPIWLNLVDEARSPLQPLSPGALPNGIALAIFLAAGVAAQTASAWRDRKREDVFLLAVASAFAMLALWQNKFGPYATFALIPGLAVQIARLSAWQSLGAATIRLAAVVLVSQATLMGAAKAAKSGIGHFAPAAPATGVDNAAEFRDPRACIAMDTLRTLNRLPAGLFAAHIDIGTHLAAHTHHRALAGPYHRIPNAILASHETFAAADEATAARIIAREGIDYVLTCRALDDPLARQPSWQGSFRARLVTGAAPDFLEPVAVEGSSLLRVWRVDWARLPTL
jgi:hypothetical protein